MAEDEVRSPTPAPSCQSCGEPIGVYEPVVHVADQVAHKTSRAAEPEICRGLGCCYHEACYEAGATVTP